MHIHTISAYETSAEEFFKRLVDWKVDLVVDTRLKNTNQLAGFTKRDDLAYFVEELVHARYVHDKLFAPAPTMMERYIHGNIGWDAYADAYREDMREREAVPQFVRPLRGLRVRGAGGNRHALSPLPCRSARRDVGGVPEGVGRQLPRHPERAQAFDSPVYCRTPEHAKRAQEAPRSGNAKGTVRR